MSEHRSEAEERSSIERRSLFDDVVGQDHAVAQLRAAATAPVHAYLLVGPPGTGKRAAAMAFAAALLCGDDDTCQRRVSSLHHPDLRVVEPEGSFLLTRQVEDVIFQASLTPAESRRQVLVLVDFHLVQPQAAPKLLKILEEPPPTTVFVVLAEHMPPELATIASRCVQIRFRPLADDVVRAQLAADGVDEATAAAVAEAAGGRLDRARLLASDPAFAGRRDAWWSLPDRLDGTGSAVAVAVDELLASIDGVVASAQARHAAERAAADEEASRYGQRAAARKELAERHRREVRRVRTDELRFGLATLTGRFRDALATGTAAPQPAAAAVAAIQRAAEALVRNPNEALLLQALLVGLGEPEVAVPGLHARTPGG